MNADKLCEKFPGAFKAVAVANDGKIIDQGDLPNLAADDFMSYCQGLSLNTNMQISRLEDKKSAIEAAKEKALFMRLNVGNNLSMLISGANAGNLTQNQKDTFIWAACYSKVMNIDLRQAFIDIFNYLGADATALVKEVAFSEGLATRTQIKSFDKFVIAACG